jgi:CheY-like chemotaxis protein
MTETQKKYKITIVDDDKFLLSMYSMKFTKEGMEVVTINDPKEALDKFKEGLTTDILILDVVMPGMDGIELLEQIRKEKLVPDAIVIILSNQGQQSDIDRASVFNIQGYIVKATTIPTEVLREVLAIAAENGK